MKVHEYALMRDVAAAQPRPRLPESLWAAPPLVVLNNFAGQEELKLATVLFQNLFPPINVQTTRLAQCQARAPPRRPRCSRTCSRPSTCRRRGWRSARRAPRPGDRAVPEPVPAHQRADDAAGAVPGARGRPGRRGTAWRSGAAPASRAAVCLSHCSKRGSKSSRPRLLRLQAAEGGRLFA